MAKIVQRKNPKTGNWVKIDTEKGRIIKTRKDKWKDIPVARKK